MENKGVPVTIKTEKIDPVKESIAEKILDEITEGAQYSGTRCKRPNGVRGVNYR